MSLEVVGVHPQGKVFANRSSSVNKAQYFVTCSDLITSVVHHFSLSANADVLIMMKFGLISTNIVTDKISIEPLIKFLL